MNYLKTFLLMALMTVVLVLAGNAIAGTEGLVWALVLAVLLNFFAYWYSDRAAIMMTGSVPLPENQAPQVYRALRELTTRAGMPMPRVYLMPVEQPNAFAAGRNPENAVVSVTRGLLHLLDYDELKGVLAHELAHIRNRDILISTIAAIMAGALVFISRIGMWGVYMGGGRRQNEGGGLITALFSLLALILAPPGRPADPHGHLPAPGSTRPMPPGLPWPVRARAGQRPAEDGELRRPASPGGQRCRLPYVYHQSPFRRGIEEPFLPPTRPFGSGSEG